MAQPVKGLLCEHANLSVIPQTHIKNVGCVSILVLLALGLKRQVNSWGFKIGQLSLPGEVQSTKEPFVQNKERKEESDLRQRGTCKNFSLDFT